MAINPQPLSRSAGPGFAPAVRPLIFAVITCTAVILLFSPAGFIYDHADLSFLVAPFLAYYILRFLSKLSFVYLPGYGRPYLGLAAACIFNGLAFGLFLFLFLGNADLLVRISWFRHIEGFLTSLSATGVYAVLFVLGLTVVEMGELSRTSYRGKPLYPPARALGQFLAGWSLWQFLAAFASWWPPLSDLGLVIFAGMIAVALANTGYYGQNSKNPFLKDAAAWLIQSTTLEFCIGAFIAVYLLFIRPFIVDMFRYAALVEWGIICLLGWRLFSGIKSGLRTRCAVDIFENDWQKHVQVISDLQGVDLPRLSEMQAAFIEDGRRDSLVIYLTLLLHNNKVSQEEINRILHPLLNHRDAKIPWFAFKWEQQRVMKQNEKDRRLILGGIIANLEYILNPGNQNIKEHTDEESKPG